MARIPRIHIEGALYYVTSRGDNNKEIFKEPVDYNMYLELLRKYKSQYGFKLFAFCFVANHLHLLIELKTGITISDIMHDLNANYTKYFNSRYSRKGHLFQERHKLVLLEKQAYLGKVSAYIHLNPVALGLAGKLEDYEYSSYVNYVSIFNTEKVSLRAPKGEAIPYEIASSPLAPRNDIKTGFFSGNYINISEEVAEFNKLNPGIKYEDILKAFSKQQMAALGQSLRKQSIMGSVDFVKKVNSQMEKIGSKNQIQANARATNKKFVLTGTGVIIILSFFTFYLYSKTIWLKKDFANELEARDTQMGKQYRQQMDSYYREMVKSLQKEKQKVKYLQEKLAGEE
ncbi:MAG: transposase [Candidatus Omnitrophota bacterium]